MSPKETSITPSNLGQIWKSMAVSESARPEDSKTVPESWIWWRFGWVIWGFAQLILNEKFPVIESVPKLLWWSGFWNSTSQSQIHQLLDVWYVLGTLEQMIHCTHAEVGDFLAEMFNFKS